MSSILRISEAANLGIHALVYLSLARPEAVQAREARVDGVGGAGLGSSPPDCSPCSAGVIARALDVSESHLAKVMQRLVAANMVSSTRGARGGFTITADPAHTSLLAVLEAIDGPVTSGGCMLGRSTCLVRACWLSELENEAIQLVHKHLGSITLADVAALPEDDNGL